MCFTDRQKRGALTALIAILLFGAVAYILKSKYEPFVNIPSNKVEVKLIGPSSGAAKKCACGDRPEDWSKSQISEVAKKLAVSRTLPEDEAECVSKMMSKMYPYDIAITFAKQGPGFEQVDEMVTKCRENIAVSKNIQNDCLCKDGWTPEIKATLVPQIASKLVLLKRGFEQSQVASCVVDTMSNYYSYGDFIDKLSRGKIDEDIQNAAKDCIHLTQHLKDPQRTGTMPDVISSKEGIIYENTMSGSVSSAVAGSLWGTDQKGTFRTADGWLITK